MNRDANWLSRELRNLWGEVAHKRPKRGSREVRHRGEFRFVCASCLGLTPAGEVSALGLDERVVLGVNVAADEPDAVLGRVLVELHQSCAAGKRPVVGELSTG